LSFAVFTLVSLVISHTLTAAIWAGSSLRADEARAELDDLFDETVALAFAALLGVFSSLATAWFASFLTSIGDILHFSSVDVSKSDLDFLEHGSDFLGFLSGTTSSSSSTTKKASEEMLECFELYTFNLITIATASTFSEAIDTVLVVDLSFLGIAQNFICSVDIFELFDLVDRYENLYFLWITTFIGMMLDSELSVSFFDFICAGIFRYS
jgi:hypothetical protein